MSYDRMGEMVMESFRIARGLDLDHDELDAALGEWIDKSGARFWSCERAEAWTIQQLDRPAIFLNDTLADGTPFFHLMPLHPQTSCVANIERWLGARSFQTAADAAAQAAL